MPATMAVAERRSRRVNLSLVLAIAASMLACNIALANAYVCEEDMSFGLELEYAGQGDMKVMHINQMPASNYERLMRVIASSFGVDEPQTEQIVDFVPHPTMPEKFEPRRVRTIYWTDPKERRWKITAEYVAKGGVYDGYEVVSPPMRSADEVEGVVRNIIASGLVEEGLKSGSHVHINASCLVHADGSARGLVNLFLLYESNEPLIRRIFGTQHLGGSQNLFSQAIYESVPDVITHVAALAPENRTIEGLTSVFNTFREKEIEHLGLAGREIISIANLKKIWKYHSINLVNSLPINSVLPAKKRTVEFRAFDLMDARSHRLAIELCRALAKKAAALAEAGVDIKLDGPLMQAPFGTESSVALLPADSRKVRTMAREFIASLGLDPKMFEHRLRLIVDGGNERVPLDSAPFVVDTATSKKSRRSSGTGAGAAFAALDTEEEIATADTKKVVKDTESKQSTHAAGERRAAKEKKEREATAERLAEEERAEREALEERKKNLLSGLSEEGEQDDDEEDSEDSLLINTVAAQQRRARRAARKAAKEAAKAAAKEIVKEERKNVDAVVVQTTEDSGAARVHVADLVGGPAMELDDGNEENESDDSLSFGAWQQKKRSQMAQAAANDRMRRNAELALQALSSCDPNPCLNGGTCVEEDKDAHCECPPNYTGDYCETSTEQTCADQPCAEHADCADVANGADKYTCTCQEGYDGDGKVQCVEIDGCDAFPCAANATCTQTGPGTRACDCNAAYEGDAYTEGCAPINWCTKPTSPCLPKAHCNYLGPDKFECICPTDFRGDGITKCKFFPPSDTVIFGPTGSFVLDSGHLFDNVANVTLSFRFKTQRSGTLFSGQNSTNSFIFLRLDSLGAQLIVNLGAGAVLASTSGSFLDGRWHTLDVIIRTPFVTIKVDAREFQLIAPAGSTGLNLPESFSIGNFGGCLTVLGIQGKNLTGGLFDPISIADYTWDCPLPDIEFTVGLVPTGSVSIPKNRMNGAKDISVSLEFRTAVRNNDALLFLAGSSTFNTEFRVTVSETGAALKVNMGAVSKFVFVTGEWADGQWHTITATISGGKTIGISVDGGVPKTATVILPNNIKGFRANGVMTIGGSFTGCLRNLYFGTELVSFRETNVAGLGFQYGCPANSDACSLSPCVNLGTCTNNIKNANNYSCACVPGVYGSYCQQSRTNTISFTGDGYLSLSDNPFAIIRLNTITFSFRTKSGAGLIFYTGRKSDDQIYMRTTDKGALVIGYELGSGIGEITANGTYNDDQWHYVVAQRVGKRSTIFVDGSLVVSAEIAGWASALNIDPTSSLNLGGLPPGDTSLAVPRFSGCIREFRVDEKMIDFSKGFTQRNRRFGCASGQVKEVGLTNGFMSFDVFNPRSESTVSFYFRTSTANGTIIYGGQSADSKDADFLAVYMRNGQVYFEFFAGYDNVVTFTKTRYDDGLWHQVTATRVGGNSILYVDSERTRGFTADKTGKVRSVDLTGSLYVGRADNGRASWPLFTGCIREVLLSSVGVGTLQLDFEKAKIRTNVGVCKSS